MFWWQILIWKSVKWNERVSRLISPNLIGLSRRDHRLTSLFSDKCAEWTAQSTLGGHPSKYQPGPTLLNLLEASPAANHSASASRTQYGPTQDLRFKLRSAQIDKLCWTLCYRPHCCCRWTLSQSHYLHISQVNDCEFGLLRWWRRSTHCFVTWVTLSAEEVDTPGKESSQLSAAGERVL